MMDLDISRPAAAEARVPALYRLPSEIWDMVCSHLPQKYDAMRLALASRHLKTYVDSRHFRWTRCHVALHPGHGRTWRAPLYDLERWDFLVQLELALPAFDLCHYCRILHPHPSPQQQSLHRPLLPPPPPLPGLPSPPACDAKDVSFGDWGAAADWGFGFSDVQAVMKRHRLGPGPDAAPQFGRPLADLTLSTAWASGHAYRRLYNAPSAPFGQFRCYTKLDAEAEISPDGHLLVHRIQRLCVPIHESGSSVLLRYGFGALAAGFRICSHHGPQSDVMIHSFLQPARDMLTLALAGVRPPRRVRRCEDCPTEYEVTFHAHPHAVEMVVDVWQNLGSCLSPTARGWYNCWGRCNPRFRSDNDDENREQWIHHEDPTPYVANETLFDTPAGLSAVADDPTLTNIWEDLTPQSYNPWHLNAKWRGYDLFPSAPRLQWQIIRAIMDARYVEKDSPRRAWPYPLPFAAVAGGTVDVSYTRSVGMIAGTVD